MYGPDFDDFVQITLKNWKAAGIEADLKLKEYGAFITSTIFGKFDNMFLGLRGPGPIPRPTSTAGSCPASRSTSGA